MRQPRVALTAAAVLAAAAYALSPLTVVFALISVWIVHRGVRGLEPRERRVIGGLLIAATALRFLAVLAVFLSTDPGQEPFRAVFGDALFTIQRSLWVTADAAGQEIGPWYRLAVFDPYGGSAFYYYLAILHSLFGPSPYAVTLLSVTSFIAGAVLLYRASREAYGAAVAGMGLAVLLFWPTFFVWSVTMLKESVLMLLTAIAVVAVWRLPRERTAAARLWLAAAVIVALVVLMTMRDAALLMAVAGLGAGLAVWVSLRSSATALTALVVALVVVASAARVPAVQRAVRAQVIEGIGRHIGHWGSTGVAYRIVDPRFYTDGTEARYTMTAPEGVRYLLRAALAFVVVPMPWHLATATAWGYLPVHFAWLFLVALAFGGAWTGARRDALLTSLLAGCCVAFSAIIAPNSGNVGTLIRHRDAIVPFLVWLSALGAAALLGAVQGRLRHPSPAFTPLKGSACA